MHGERRACPRPWRHEGAPRRRVRRRRRPCRGGARAGARPPRPRALRHARAAERRSAGDRPHEGRPRARSRVGCG